MFLAFFNYAGAFAVQLLKETVPPNDYFVCTPCRKLWQHIFQKNGVVFEKFFPVLKCIFEKSCCLDGNTKYINHAARINLYRDA